MIRRHAVCSVLLLACLFEGAYAQTTGLPPFGSFTGGPFDIVNNANGNVHFSFPFVSRAGRAGTSFSYNLVYDSAVWTPVTTGTSTAWTPAANWGWAAVTQPQLGYLSYSAQQQSATCPINPPYNMNTVTVYWTLWGNFAYVDSLGTVHPFSGVSVSNWQQPSGVSQPCGGSASNGPIAQVSQDGSGYNLSVWAAPGGSLNSSLADRSGDAITAPPLGAGSGSFVDTNGNLISASISGSTTTFTDTLGSTPLTVSGAGTPATPLVLTYTNPQGGSSSYHINYTNYQIRTAFACAGVVEYTSSSQSLVSSIALPDGTSYSFTYEPTPGFSGATTGRVASITLPTGGVLTYQYSGVNCSTGTPATLTRTTPDGTWTYNFLGGTTTVTDPTAPTANQTVIQFQGLYETERKLYQGSATTGTLLGTIDTCYNNATVPCTTQSVSLPISQVSTTTTLPGSSNLVSNTTTLYNGNGLPTETDQYDFGNGAPGKVISKSVTIYTTSLNGIVDHPASVQVYDGASNLVMQTTFGYDESSISPTSGTPNHLSASGSRGNVTTISRSTGSSTLTQKFTYFDTGIVNQSTDVNGAVTTYTYAACGNSLLTSTALPLGLSISQTWNCSGTVATATIDSNGWTNSTVYNDPSLWRPTSATDSTGMTTYYSYGTLPQTFDSHFTFSTNAIVEHFITSDSLGRPHLQQTKQAQGSTAFDSTETDYDALGRTSRLSMPYTGAAGQTNSSVAATAIIYDALSRPMQVTDGGNGYTAYDFSQNNDVLVTIGPAAAGENLKKKQLEYDGAGHVNSVCEITAAAGSGACGQNNAQTGFLTKYTYNAAGQLTNVVQNAQGATTQTRTYRYDLLGRVVSEKNPETNQAAITYTYDSDPSQTCASSAGDLVKRTDANGNVTCYAYDALHRLVSIIYPGGPNAAATDSRFFIYDAATVNGVNLPNTKGRLAEAYTGSASSKKTDLGFGYSSRGEITDTYEATPQSGGYYHVSATYWDNGLTKTLATSFTELPAWTFTPDGEGRIASISASSGQSPLVSATYNTAGQPLSLTFGSQDSDTFGYDDSTGRQTSYSFNVNSRLQTGTLSWSPNGTLYQLAVNDPFASNNNAWTCTNVYDDLIRLTGNNCGSAWSQTFSYDSFGNIQKSGSVTFQPTYDVTTNRYSHLPSGTPSYDGNGAITNDGFHSYGLDAEGRNVQIDSNAATLTYDAFGRWVERHNSGSPVQAVYAPDGTMLVVPTGTGVVAAYLHLPGGAIANYGTSGLGSYWHPDWLGTPRLYSTPSRQIVGDMQYAPFGETYSGGAIDSFFTGVAQNVEANDFRNFPARDLHTIQGRWLRPDPAGLSAVDITNPQTWNRYAYVRNNPLSNTDPSGLDSCTSSNNYCGLGAPGASPTSNPAAYQNFISQQMYAGNDLAFGWDAFSLLDLPAVTIASKPPTFAPGSGSAIIGNYLVTGQLMTDPGWTMTASPFSLYSGLFAGQQIAGNGQQRMGPRTPAPVSPAQLAPTQPKFCGGSFAFAGTEADFGEGQVFVGAIGESNLQGLDAGSLYEAGMGGEGISGGFAVTQSFKTGNISGFGYLGTGISGGPLAGIHFGAIYSPHEFGFYYEGHVGSVARGGGYAVTGCGR